MMMCAGVLIAAHHVAPSDKLNGHEPERVLCGKRPCAWHLMPEAEGRGFRGVPKGAPPSQRQQPDVCLDVSCASQRPSHCRLAKPTCCGWDDGDVAKESFWEGRSAVCQTFGLRAPVRTTQDAIRERKRANETEREDGVLTLEFGLIESSPQ